MTSGSRQSRRAGQSRMRSGPYIVGSLGGALSVDIIDNSRQRVVKMQEVRAKRRDPKVPAGEILGVFGHNFGHARNRLSIRTNSSVISQRSIASSILEQFELVVGSSKSTLPPCKSTILSDTRPASLPVGTLKTDGYTTTMHSR